MRSKITLNGSDKTVPKLKKYNFKVEFGIWSTGSHHENSFSLHSEGNKDEDNRFYFQLRDRIELKKFANWLNKIVKEMSDNHNKRT